MEITVLGSGTGEPSLKRGAPGILLQVKGRAVLLDSGPGTLRPLLAHGVSYLDIDTILYSHLHCDHIAELAPILFAMRNMALSREKDLTLIGPPGFADHYQGLRKLYEPTLDAEGYKVRVEEICERTLDLPEGRLIALPVNHSGCAIGFRIETEGRIFSYSGDTGYCDNLISLGRGADLLALDCSFPDELKVEWHLTPGLAGTVATRSGCRRLLLTHLYPVCDGFDIIGQCRKAYAGEIIVASDGMVLEI
ncbi:MAG: MBL fold metallo-hydrolase [Candidatus Aureabacteria bacterium]|nr:MBL fold metallo-hydrolase [Candidatus Auribacterota bacterium]